MSFTLKIKFFGTPHTFFFNLSGVIITAIPQEYEGKTNVGVWCL